MGLVGVVGVVAGAAVASPASCRAAAVARAVAGLQGAAGRRDSTSTRHRSRGRMARASRGVAAGSVARGQVAAAHGMLARAALVVAAQAQLACWAPLLAAEATWPPTTCSASRAGGRASRAGGAAAGAVAREGGAAGTAVVPRRGARPPSPSPTIATSFCRCGCMFGRIGGLFQGLTAGGPAATSPLGLACLSGNRMCADVQPLTFAGHQPTPASCSAIVLLFPPDLSLIALNPTMPAPPLHVCRPTLASSPATAAVPTGRPLVALNHACP